MFSSWKARGYELKLLFDDEKKREFWGRVFATPQDISLPESFSGGMGEGHPAPGDHHKQGVFPGGPQGQGSGPRQEAEKGPRSVFEEQGPSFRERYSEPDDASGTPGSRRTYRGKSFPTGPSGGGRSSGSGPPGVPGSSGVDLRKNDIFIVGDAHQRIYKRQTVLSPLRH